MSEFTLYSRPGCHLCEVMLAALEPLLAGRGSVRVVDIDGDPALRERYGRRIPVLAHGNVDLCQYHLDPPAVLAVLDRHGGEA
ncbi:MAG: glutaredoxin family protein [Gammaproteobacteria bacterium]|nr:glutaredoxin family protein [Gammaproteobacteria bacterium]TVQ49641.1 MAG: glutaredoxin family protein [Gammaproteobacteria bacterium]